MRAFRFTRPEIRRTPRRTPLAFAGLAGLAAALALAGCAAPLQPQAPTAAAPVAAWAGARTYAGSMSCADCAAGRRVLTVFADGTFRMREGDEGAATARYTTGRWSVAPDAADVIVLRGAAAPRSFRRVRPDGFVEIGADTREPLAAAAPLARAAVVDPLAGPMRVAGMYRREAGAPVLAECSTGRRLAVAPAVRAGAGAASRAGDAPGAAQAALDAAHRAISARPDDAVLALVQGYFVPTGDARAEAFVVTVFERAMRDGRCEDAPLLAR